MPPPAAARHPAQRAASEPAVGGPLDYADADLRLVLADVLGGLLRATYTVDPAVTGTVTLHTGAALPRTALLAVLQSALATAGASLVRDGAVYRVAPVASTALAPGLAAPDSLDAGSVVLPLRYASAVQLAPLLRPYLAGTGRIIPDAGRNTLLVGGEPASRQAVAALVTALDVDAFAGMSYALLTLPDASADAKEVAGALREALRTGGAAGVVVLPLGRVGAVLLMSRLPGELEQGRRLFALMGNIRRAEVPGWSAHALQAGNSRTTAELLRDALAGTPVRVVADENNNALLIRATPAQLATVEAMLRKVDLPPRQVRVDVTVAEVTLNDALRFGTRFFFESGGLTGQLNAGSGTAATGTPGLVLGGSATTALSALQAVTTVRVLSSPQVVVVENGVARIQVGDLVPVLTSASQGTLSADAPVVNGVDYRRTGVTLEVAPQVSASGLVILDIAQEVSAVDASSAGITGSPSFTDRAVTSRVAVTDGQTVALAGVVRDTATTASSGIPWLKDVPVLGLAAGLQDNSRARTELLILVTPHVAATRDTVHALTDDLRDGLPRAGGLASGVMKP